MGKGDRVDMDFLEYSFKEDNATLREFLKYTFGCGCFVLVEDGKDEAIEFEVCNSDQCARERAKTNYGKDKPF